MYQIPNYLETRKDIPIKNNYYVHFDVPNKEEYHIVIYYINDYKCSVKIKRMDHHLGWKSNMYIVIKDIDDVDMDKIPVGHSDEKALNNSLELSLEVKIKLEIADVEYEQKIPKKIVQVYISNGYDDFSLLRYNSCMTFIELNPEYEYYCFNFATCRKFLKEHFDEDVLEAFDTIIPISYKSDLFRLCFLYIMGGCYFDCKQILKIPLRDVIACNTELVLNKSEYYGNNNVIMAMPNNSYFKECIDDLVNIILKKKHVYSVFYFGPLIILTYEPERMNVLYINEQKKNRFLKFNDKMFLHCWYNDYYDTCYGGTKSDYKYLYKKRTVYYINKRNIDKYIIYVFQHKFNIVFNFEIYDNVIKIIRTDKKIGWIINLELCVINNDTNMMYSIDVGPSKKNCKYAYIFKSNQID